MRTLISRVLALALVLVGLQATAIADPAWACGCGAAYLSSGAVAGEQSVIRFDGHQETITLQLRLNNVKGGAGALVLPVPSAAQTSLGNRQLIPTLQALILPQTVVRHYLFGDPEGGGVGAASAPNPGVSVLSEQHLGALDVVQLGATNVAALGGWLAANGFTLSAGVAKGLSSYVAEGWRYVAIKLDLGAAAADGGATGLDPIDVSFDTPKLVYPMRLSANATDQQSVTLYILAPHEMQVAEDPVAGENDAANVLFADWVTAGQVLQAPMNGGRRMFLTVYQQTFAQPSLITGDFGFVQAGRDQLQVPAPYVDWEPAYWLGLRPAVVLALAALLLLVLVLALVVVRRRTTVGRGRGR
jgi:hypothetical protein